MAFEFVECEEAWPELDCDDWGFDDEAVVESFAGREMLKFNK